MEEEHELVQLNPSDNNNGDNEEEEKLENVAELKKELIEKGVNFYLGEKEWKIKSKKNKTQGYYMLI